MFSVSPPQVLQRLQQNGEVRSGITLLCLPKFVEMAPLLSSLLFLFFFNIFFILRIFGKILFIYGCVGSSFLCEGFPQLWQEGATLHRGAWASHCRGLSCCGAQAPDAQAQ